MSVTILAKDCAPELRRCLASLQEHFLRDVDEVIVLDTSGTDGGETTRVAREMGARVIDGRDLRQSYKAYVEKWLPEFLDFFAKSSLANGALLDFGGARQKLMDAARHDVQFWIDSDDVLAERVFGGLREAIEEVMGGDKGDSIFLDYLYGTDPDDGSCCSVLKRERVIDRRKYYWKGRCHETAIPRPGVQCHMRGAYVDNLRSAIQHKKEPTGAGKTNTSDLRNYVILRRELEEDLAADRTPDPRTEFYLANAARGLGRDVEALQRYKEFIKKSGSRDDRFAAAYFVATIYIGPRTLRPLDALDWFEKCVRLKPDDPRGYFGMSRSYMILARPGEALHWHNVGRTLPEPANSLHNYDPRHIRVLPYQIAAAAAKELGDEGMAAQACEELIRVSPNHPDSKRVVEMTQNWIAGRRLVGSVRTVVANSRPKSQEEIRTIGRSIVAHLPDVPEELADLGLLPTEPADARPTGRGDVAIYCGKAVEGWGPKSGETGIGGSEKAVIQMAPRLQKRGFRVTVYCNVPKEQRGVQPDGVSWQHFGAFDYERERDTMIFWRSPELLEFKAPIKRRILWCHDVQASDRWSDVRVALADEVWVLSEAHAKTLGKWREPLGAKLVITRNGIDSDLFRRLAGAPRDPKKVVYCSSPDRGLLTAIRMFQAADVEGSTLHIFYGFGKLWYEWASKTEYMSICDIGRDANMYEYMQEIHNLVDNDERIKWHGRVGWETLAKELTSAGVWLYPTRFYEISCMAAMEAQAAGCLPITTKYAALEETVFSGHMVHLDQTPEANAQVLQAAMLCNNDTQRAAIARTAQERFDYETLADEWAARLAPVKV